jgi:hypothetical protein
VTITGGPSLLAKLDRGAFDVSQPGAALEFHVV